MATTSKSGASSKSTSAQGSRSKSYIAGVVVGGLIVTAALGHALIDGSQYLVRNSAQVQDLVNWVLNRNAAPAPEGTRAIGTDMFREPMYFTRRDSDGKLHTWKVVLKGSSSLTGEVEDLATGNKGVVHGYYRAGTLVLTYASASVDRPGIGTIVLRPYRSGLAPDPLVFAGGAVVHACECGDGSVRDNGPMMTEPALLTNRAKPSDRLINLFLSAQPYQLRVVFPAEVQQNAQK